MDAIRSSYRLEAAFPLRVRFLDYSVSVYARRAD